MPNTITPKELAKALDTNAKLVRSFLRSKDSGLAAEAPGKGGRWAIDARKVKGLKGKFAKWEAKRAEEIAAARKAREDTDTPEDDTPSTEDAPNEA